MRSKVGTHTEMGGKWKNVLKEMRVLRVGYGCFFLVIVRGGSLFCKSKAMTLVRFRVTIVVF